jgi:hypothetical protein
MEIEKKNGDSRAKKTGEDTECAITGVERMA